MNPPRPAKSTSGRRGASGKTLAGLGERAFLARVRGWFIGEKAPAVALGIGDDAAVLRAHPGGGTWVVTTDSLVEGVHFRWDWTTPRDLGRKALAASLSDLAAMGARPVAAFLALSVPPATRLADLAAFFRGLRAEGRRYGCPLAGGDLTRAPQWVVCLTLIGQVPATRGASGARARSRSRPGSHPESIPRPALRSAARSGQTLYVTGWPGESGAGLEALRRGIHAPALIRRHRRPTPRLAESAALTRRAPGLAMIDVSDGVWNEATLMAEASGVGIELDYGALPVSPALRRFARRLGVDPLQWVLFGGEDYELLIAGPDDLQRGKPINPTPIGRIPPLASLTRIGRIVPGHGVRLLDSRRAVVPIADRTFRHFE